MKIAIDNSPIVSTHKLADKIRGTGFYIKNLIDALSKYHPTHEYLFFTQGQVPPKADIYHYPYFEPFFLSLPKNKPGRTVVTVHDVTPLVFPKLFPVGIKGKFKFRIQKHRVGKADAIITDAQSSVKDIHKILGIKNEKIHSIPLAPADIYKQQRISTKEKKLLTSKLRLPESFVLYVGDATPNKNLKRLVDAAVLAKFPLVMIGGALVKKDVVQNPWNNDLLYAQKIAQEAQNIYLPGYVSDQDLVSLYSMADAFVFPSLYEGFGLPLLEAASCGAPIITSREGSIPEVIGEAACFVNPYEVDDIAKKVTDVLLDKKLANRLSAEALQQARKFSWRKTANQTIKLYEKIYSEA